MKTLKLQIPNMQSSHCQMRVNNALSTISGATSISIQSGLANVSLNDDTSKREVVSTIEKAGYYITDIIEDNLEIFHDSEFTTQHSHC